MGDVSVQRPQVTRKLAPDCMAISVCLGVLMQAGPALAGNGQGFRILPEKLQVAPGEWVQLTIEPDTPTRHSDPLRWTVVGRGVIRDGRYGAPYVVAAAGERARIIARAGAEIAESSVELAPGSSKDAADCLGPNQDWGPTGRMPPYTPADELPEAIVHPQPQYPKSLQLSNVRGTLIVNVLVCRSGRVIDASAQWGVGVTPIPELETLAVQAALHYVFKPARVAGQPIATMVAIPFSFPPP